MSLDEEKIATNEKLIKDLIVKNVKDGRAEYLLNVLTNIRPEDEYFLAPASTRTEYHNCFVGGLADHSLRVFKYARKISSALCPDRYDVGTLLVSSLFHDLGKVGDGVEPYYVWNDSDWHRDKLGELFKINKRCLQMPTSERGLYILQRFCFPLTEDEYLAIRLNDGQYVEENRYYRNREPELALIVHWADLWSAKEEKSDQKSKIDRST